MYKIPQEHRRETVGQGSLHTEVAFYIGEGMDLHCKFLTDSFFLNEVLEKHLSLHRGEKNIVYLSSVRLSLS